MNRLSKFLLLAVTLVMGACNEEKFAVDSPEFIEEGLPATISFQVKVPGNHKLNISRAAESFESQVSELMIVMFEQTSGRAESIILKGSDLKSIQDASAGGSQCYTTTSDIKTLSGKYRAYFIANWESGFASLQDLEEKVTNKTITEDQLRDMIATNADLSQLVGQYRLPMTFYMNELNIYPDNEDGTPNPNNAIGKYEDDKHSVMLRRVTSHINFTFKTAGDGITFNPTSVTVYNLPKQAALFDALHFDGAPAAPTTFNITNENQTFDTQSAAVINSEFSFLMLESLPVAKAGATFSTWIDREKWDESTQNSDPATRAFTNAPEFAPYVVVTGTYSDATVSGNTTYFIHLGNFGSSQSENNASTDRTGVKGSYSNFNVRRNEEQNYTITITGINSIRAEVGLIEGTDNPAAEGHVVMLSTQNTVSADAHFEQAMLRIPKSALNTTGNADFTGAVLTYTPITKFQSKIYVVDANGNFYNATIDSEGKAVATGNPLGENDVDCKWVQFQKPEPANITTFPAYAGRNTNGTLNAGLGYINDLFAHPADYCIDDPTDNQYYYTVAWIDENMYLNLSPSAYIGQDLQNRMLVFNPNPIRRSPDGQSTVISDFAFTIDQKPIFTPINIEGGYTNPFGFEVVEEMAEPVFVNGNFNATNGVTNSGLEWSGPDPTTIGMSKQLSGQKNTVEQFSDFTLDPTIHIPNYGYFYNTTTEKYTLNQSGITNTLTAMMARNRDIDGSGTLEEDEILWYMPTFTQYAIFWIGRQNIKVNLRLYPLDKRQDAAGTAVNDINIPRYFCSGSSTRSIFWQDQGSCSPWEHVNTTWFQKKHCVRFARNLGTSATSYSDNISRLAIENNTTDHYIRVNSPEITRNYTVGYINPPYLYPFMYQNTTTDEITKIPSALEYMPALIPLTTGTTDAEIYEIANNSNGQTALANMIKSNYSGAETLFNQGWRIPNQNELLLLQSNGVLNLYNDNNLTDINGSTITTSTSAPVAIPACTWLSETTRPCFFMLIGSHGNTVYGSFPGDLSGLHGSQKIYAILVRDYVPASTASNDGRFSGGSGSAIK